MTNKRFLRKLAAGVLTCTVTATAINPAVFAQQGINVLSDGALTSPILITEIVPNTDNLGGSDGYEFFELVNVTDREVDLANYDLVYNNNGTKTVWTPNVTKIPAKGTLVIWIKNDGNQTATKDQFLNYYQLPQDTVVGEVESGGFVNSGSRELTLQTKTGIVLNTVSYNSAESDAGEAGKLDVNEAIVYAYNGADVTRTFSMEPTPTKAPEITGDFAVPETVEQPSAVYTEVTELRKGENLEVELTDTNLGKDSIVNAELTVKELDKSYAMTYGDDGKLSVTVPGEDLELLSSFQYYVTLFDGTNTAQGNTYTVKVGDSQETVDATKAPALVVTELAPDTNNVSGGADAYEFIEIYNNADQPVNLKDYKLVYNYPDSGSDAVWWETSEDKVLDAGQTLVFWVKNGSNDQLTIEDFNKEFGTNLTEDQLIQISCGGMANSGARGMKIVTNVNDLIDYVVYNNEDGVDDTNPQGSIKYQNRYDINSETFSSFKISNDQTASPGSVTDEKPQIQATLKTPAQAPQAVDQSDTSFNNETASLNFSVQATQVDAAVKTVKLYLKYNDKDYTVYNLTRTNGDIFGKEINNTDLLNKRSYTYYFEVSDGFQTTKTEEKTITNTTENLSPDFNLTDGQYIAKTQQIITNGDKLLVDGKDVSKDCIASPNGIGKIVFDATQTDTFFKNAVSIGSDILGVFNEGTYADTKTYAYDVNAKYYDPESKTITVEFHAGNKANPLEHNIENNDDFELKNIRMVLPNGETLTPVSYEGKYGLGEVEHNGMDQVEKKPVEVPSQESSIKMGDGTSKVEILYATFKLDDTDFDGIRYDLDTTQLTDGEHTIANGQKEVKVNVDNTAPALNATIKQGDTEGEFKDGETYHNGTISVGADDGQGAGVSSVEATLDGEKITGNTVNISSQTMAAGEHTLWIKGADNVGNTAEKTITFTIPEENAVISNIKPADGETVTGDPTLSVKVDDPTDDNMTVTFKKGEKITLANAEKVSTTKGISATAGVASNDFEAGSKDGFPYEQFDLKVDSNTGDNSAIAVRWEGKSNNAKTFMYVYNTVTGSYEKTEATQTEQDGKMTLEATVMLKDHLADGIVKIMVQNGEGYTPSQYAAGTEGENATTNPADTPRDDYDFTFAVESDTQYYNEDYDGNVDQGNDGNYQYQLDIHNFILNNRERMNIQYLFHDGDIIDDEPNVKEWEQADAAYKLLDDARLPYGLLAGNHDVGHLSGDYSNYTKYFGQARYQNNPWYGGSYQDNRCHYDLITVDGIDFIMLYTGWGIGDEQIDWMNDVLSQYPERKAILNFHEYLLASGGLGEEPQRVYDEVIAKNDNVCMVFSGHYHNATTETYTFKKADGSTRTVKAMLFDYQGLDEGGLGYMRLLHFDTDGQKMIVRTYSPSLNDYDAKASENPRPGNEEKTPADDSGVTINGEEEFEVSFDDLGIIAQEKTLETQAFTANVPAAGDDSIIGTAENVKSGSEASVVWQNAPEGTDGWYAEVTDANGGYTATDVQYVTVKADGDTDPSDPTDPGDPSQPTDPSDPANPSNPSDNGGSGAPSDNANTGLSSNAGMLATVTAAFAAVMGALGTVFFKKRKRSDK